MLVKNQEKKKKRDSRYLLAAYKKVKYAETEEEKAQVAVEIERIGAEYFGENIPFVGDVLKHVERLHGVDPEIYDEIRKLWD